MNLIPSILTALLTIAGLFTPQIQSALSAHPQAALVVGGVYAVLNHLMPSPVASSTGTVSGK